MNKLRVLGLLLALTASTVAFQFAIIGDRVGSHVPGVFEGVMAEVNRLHPDFAINVGDLIEGYTSDYDSINAQWNEVDKLLAVMAVPFHRVPGNHDEYTAEEETVYVKRFGTPYYSFDYENCHFVVLDNARFEQPTPWPAAQVEWLKQDLAKNKAARYTFVFYHKPFWYNNLLTSTAPGDLHDIFKDGGVDYVFGGHTHTACRAEIDGIVYTIVGSSGGGIEPDMEALGEFFQYDLVDVSDAGVKVAIVRAGSILPPDYVTIADHKAIERIMTEAVSQTRLPVVRSGGGAQALIDGRADVLVRNFLTDSIRSTLAWTLRPTAWKVQPASFAVTLPPGGQQTVPARFTLANRQDLFPLPGFTLPGSYHKKSLNLSWILDIERQFRVPRVKTPPVIDGKLDDAAWAERPVTIFGAPDGGANSMDLTELRVADDEQNLYIAVVCTDKEMDKLVARETARDGSVFADDNVWFFFGAGNDPRTYYQLMINALGTVFDRKCVMVGGQSQKDLAWNGNWQVKTSREKDRWTVELAIDKASLGGAGQKTWGFNFRRLQNRTSSACIWQYPFVHDPAKFGKLEME